MTWGQLGELAERIADVWTRVVATQDEMSPIERLEVEGLPVNPGTHVKDNMARLAHCIHPEAAAFWHAWTQEVVRKQREDGGDVDVLTVGRIGEQYERLVEHQREAMTPLERAVVYRLPDDPIEGVEWAVASLARTFHPAVSSYLAEKTRMLAMQMLRAAEAEGTSPQHRGDDDGVDAATRRMRMAMRAAAELLEVALHDGDTPTPR